MGWVAPVEAQSAARYLPGCRSSPTDAPHHRQGAGKKAIEVVYLIPSCPTRAATPSTLTAWGRPWGIGNRLHWARDVTFDEHRSQVPTGDATGSWPFLRNNVISLLRLAGWANIAKSYDITAKQRRPLALLALKKRTY